MEEEKAMEMSASANHADTVPRMFWHGVKTRAAKTIFRQKDFGIWQAVTWDELGRIAREIGMGLASLGYAPGEVVSILSNTNKEWMAADLGALGAAGVVNGIYPTDAPIQVEYLLFDSGSVYAFVEDEEQLDKVLEVRDRMPGLRKIVVFDMEGLHELNDPQVMSLDALRALGREHDAAHPGEWERRIGLRKPEDLAILCYTSGTTGKPKGAMISHGNIMATCAAYQALFPQDENDERMAFLPLCHIAERVGGEYHALYTGAVLNFVENPETVPENVREIAPTVFTAVPRVWEKFYSGVLIRLKEAGALQQSAYKVAIAIGYRQAKLREERKPVPAGLAFAFWLARLLVLNNVRKAIGVHRSKILITAAAPIAPDLVRWYMALGLEMLEAWGQTESCGAVTGNPRGGVKPGSIGPMMPPSEVKLSPEGELLVRGPGVFMGYLHQPEKTAETIADGWLHTGDVGKVDAEGYFYITDRMKDIIITAGGKNITPSEIENQLKFSPYITDAVVIGEKRPYLTALVMIDHENVEKYAQDNAIPFSNYASLCRRPEIQELIQGEIERVNKTFARVEQLKKFRLIEQKLTAEDEELTPTMKLKRRLVNDKYKALIDSMYMKEAA
ncbi:MAG: fatty-acid--CoA ligase [Betaproteobacteria bacterium RBG_16_66_20]|nr:MAG: fatty-acid--CoA ligase [Betaproteobacteria bacterium RBG_16_66_20]